jgi:hypothetical protein
MDVNTRLLAGEEEQAELTVAKNGGSHSRTVADYALEAG